MHSQSYYVKSFVLSCVLFVESFVLSRVILEFVKNHSIFSVSLEYSLTVVGLMLLLIYTFSLSVGGWGRWEQYIFLPLPVALAVFITTFDYSPIYAPIAAVVALILFVLDIEKSSRLKSLMTRFDPRIILRFSTRGLLFIFSIFGAVLFILNSIEQPAIDIGRKVAEMTEEPVKRIVENQMKEQALSGLGGLSPFGANEQVTENLKQLGVDDTYNLSVVSTPIEGLTLGDFIENQVNDFIEPYKSFLTPVMAVLTFTLFQFYASIAFGVYVLTIYPIFKLFQKIGLFKTEVIQVDKEILTF